MHQCGMMAHVTYTSMMTLATAAGRMTDTAPKYIERMHEYIDDARKRDIRITQCITDAKGDRSRPPGKQDDPDAYVRVVDRQSDGVVIRGAKLHITGASMGHELMTIPTKAMKAGEEDYAIAAMIPVNSPGVKIVDTTYAPRHDDIRDFPVSGARHYPEGLRDLRRRLRARTSGSSSTARSPRRRCSPTRSACGSASAACRAMADGGDLLVGLAQLIAEANGLAGEAHIKEKISEMIIHATVMRACLEAALMHSKAGPFGAAFPDELYTNAGKYTGAANYNLMVRHLHDIAGGAVVTAPSLADLENPDTGPLLKKYMGTGSERRRRVPHPAVPR